MASENKKISDIVISWTTKDNREESRKIKAVAFTAVSKNASENLKTNILETLKSDSFLNLYFLLKRSIKKGEEPIKVIDAFMKTFLGSLFTTCFSYKSSGKEDLSLSLLTKREFEIWSQIISQIIKGKTNIKVKDPFLMVAKANKENINEKLYTEKIQAKKSIVSLTDIECVTYLSCGENRICYFTAFPSYEEEICNLCLDLIYLTVCKTCDKREGYG